MFKLNFDQQRRLKAIIKKLLIILTVGLAYYVFVRLTGIGIPCIIRLITGKHCPGCGLTRMCIALISGDIALAFRSNALLMCALPFIAVFGVRRAFLYVKSGAEGPDRAETVFIVIAFVFTVAFWVLRNTESFSYLAPLGM